VPGPAGYQQRRCADFVQDICVVQAVPSLAQEAVRQVRGSAEVAERELSASYEQFGLPRAGQTATSFASGEQVPVFEQVQPV
jgi:hypothetical protein